MTPEKTKTTIDTNTNTNTKPDPKRSVEVIELDHLEDVVGGQGGGSNRRMSTEAAQ